jgi:hypothetical protein
LPAPWSASVMPSAPRAVLQQLFDELEQVVDLLELAPRILVELALAREDVQLLEQLDATAPEAHTTQQQNHPRQAQ